MGIDLVSDLYQCESLFFYYTGDPSSSTGPPPPPNMSGSGAGLRNEPLIGIMVPGTKDGSVLPVVGLDCASAVVGSGVVVSVLEVGVGVGVGAV